MTKTRCVLWSLCGKLFFLKFQMKLHVFYIMFFLLTTGLMAQDKVQAEKVKVEFSNVLLHTSLRNKEKSTTEVELVIPTSQPSAKCWNFRAWETNHPMREAIELLEVGVSYQINHFIITGEAYLNADKNQREILSKITKEYNIQLIIKSATFKTPLKKGDLEDLEEYAAVKNADVLISIDNSLSFNNDITLDYLKKILATIKNKNKKIYCDSFSRDEGFLNALQQLNDSRIIPSINWTKGNWSLTAPLNTLIGKCEGNSIIRMDVSLDNFGNNEILAILPDYIGYRQTQCLEANKNILGFSMNFGTGITSFGTLNAINIFTMAEFLLNKEKDLDIINDNWFTAAYGHKDGLEIMNSTANSANILRQSLYINNSGDVEYSKNITPTPLQELLTAGTLSSWCKFKKGSNYKSSSIFKEKIRAKELIDVLEKNYKAFISNKKISNSAVTILQIQKTKEMVEMMQDYTSIFLQAQQEAIGPADLEILKPHIKKFPAIENSIKELKEIYIEKKPDILELIPQENLPTYLQKEIKTEKSNPG